MGLAPIIIPAVSSLLGAGISAVGAGMSAATQREEEEKRRKAEEEMFNKKLALEASTADRQLGMQGYQSFLDQLAGSQTNARLRTFRQGLAQL